jgi:Protein of unknown function (DUF3311)
VAEPDGSGRRRITDLPTGVVVGCAVLVLAPIVALLWVGSYARRGPELWGFPFFYWYQLMWVFIASLGTSIAYQLIARARRDGGDK